MAQLRLEHPRGPAHNVHLFLGELGIIFHLASHPAGTLCPYCFLCRITQTSLHGHWFPRCQNQELLCIVRTRPGSHSRSFENIWLAQGSQGATSVSKWVWWEAGKCLLQRGVQDGRDRSTFRTIWHRTKNSCDTFELSLNTMCDRFAMENRMMDASVRWASAFRWDSSFYYVNLLKHKRCSMRLWMDVYSEEIRELTEDPSRHSFFILASKYW